MKEIADAIAHLRPGSAAVAPSREGRGYGGFLIEKERVTDGDERYAEMLGYGRAGGLGLVD